MKLTHTHIETLVGILAIAIWFVVLGIAIIWW